MTEALHLDSAAFSAKCPAGFAEPRMVRIPEGWFQMGSESGQDNERPVHRVG